LTFFFFSSSLSDFDKNKRNLSIGRVSSDNFIRVHSIIYQSSENFDELADENIKNMTNRIINRIDYKLKEKNRFISFIFFVFDEKIKIEIKK